MPFLRDRLRNTRKDKNMTLEDVAEIVGVAKQTIQRYETGEIKSVDTSTVEKLANALHVTPGYLMGWTDDPNGFSSDAEINPKDNTDIIVYDKGKIYDAGKLTEKAQSDIDEILKNTSDSHTGACCCRTAYVCRTKYRWLYVRAAAARRKIFRSARQR